MDTGRLSGPSPKRGTALLVTMVFIMLFASLALAITTAANANLAIGRNRVDGGQASALAELGVLLVQDALGGLPVPESSNPSVYHSAIASHLKEMWKYSSMVDTVKIAETSSHVWVPGIRIARPDGRVGYVSLSVAVEVGPNPYIDVTSLASFGEANREVHYKMKVHGGQYTLGRYGVASKSRIEMVGNVGVDGATLNVEGSVCSATYSDPIAVSMEGHCFVAGDVAVVNPSGSIYKLGNVTVGGNELIGVAEPEWPEVDTSVFEPYAQNVLSDRFVTDGTYSNIRIPGGTNPLFSGNTNLYGVVFVESPNVVIFSGNLNITGVIVGETPTIENLDANRIEFLGNVNSSGVENLPAGGEFDGLQSQTGSFLLAEGFSATFTGNFHTINGCLVASRYEFSGNAGGTVRGGVINLKDSEFLMLGNANVTVDRNGADDTPAGLKSARRIVCVRGSFAE
jgi:hypothetical protein